MKGMGGLSQGRNTGPRPTRRRVMAVIAAFAGLPVARAAPGGADAGNGAAFPDKAGINNVVSWRGLALGGPAEIVLHHPDEDAARRLVARVVAEIARLEGIFSLQRADSAVSQLNHTGALAAPPKELFDLLFLCRDYHTVTKGVFDPTVQPLWTLYSRHFAASPNDTAGPDAAAIAAARALVGFDKVYFNRERVTFAQPGMALTLNGIARGFVTYLVLELLRRAGMTSSLVNLGEIGTIGSGPNGGPWRVGLFTPGEASPERKSLPEGKSLPDKSIDLTDRAVATSSPGVFYFDASRRFSHLLDPRNGRTATRYARMSVIARDPVTADALSTALSVLAPDEVRAFTQAEPSITADFVPAS